MIPNDLAPCKFYITPPVADFHQDLAITCYDARVCAGVRGHTRSVAVFKLMSMGVAMRLGDHHHGHFCKSVTILISKLFVFNHPRLSLFFAYI
jgi:hypothetical protein